MKNTIQTMTFEEIYLDYVNNFLTIERMAEHYGEDVFFLKAVIKYVESKNTIKRILKKVWASITDFFSTKNGWVNSTNLW